jgi:hypothetical protein
MSAIEGGFGIIHGAAGGRRSANTSNHYTVILDHALSPLGFPKRSASIIAANWENRHRAEHYGTMYAILPFDGVKIGICPGDDMFETEIRIAGRNQFISDWNNEFDYLDVRDTSFTTLISDLKELKEDDSQPAWLKRIDEDAIEEIIKSAYAKPFKLTTTKEASYNDGGRHEVWIGGKCIAIDLGLYDQMMDNQRDSEDDE